MVAAVHLALRRFAPMTDDSATAASANRRHVRDSTLKTVVSSGLAAGRGDLDATIIVIAA